MESGPVSTHVGALPPPASFQARTVTKPFESPPASDQPSDAVDVSAADPVLPEQTIPPEQDPTLEPDTLFTDSFREARVILLMWVCCFVWTMVVCLSNGYPGPVDPATFPTVLGIPGWVAWGIVFPWLVADAVTIWFCFYRMKDGDLGSAPGEEAAGEEA